MGERSLTNVMIGLTASAPGRITPGQRYLGNVTSFRKDVEVWVSQTTVMQWPEFKVCSALSIPFWVSSWWPVFQETPHQVTAEMFSNKANCEDGALWVEAAA